MSEKPATDPLQRWANMLSWLDQLVWVSWTEQWLLAALAIGAAMGVAFAWSLLGWQPALAYLVGHALLTWSVAAIVPRRFSATALAIILLSLVNYCIFAGRVFGAGGSVQRAVAAAYIYLALGLLAVLISTAWLPAIRKRWQTTLNATASHGFRWALTEAPLAIRLRIAAIFARWRASFSDVR